MFFEKYTHGQIRKIIFDALKCNSDYRNGQILGVPGSTLDPEVFYDDAPFIKKSPFLSALVSNPNHIGCHTLSEPGEELFAGTQKIETDLIRICAEELFAGEKNEQDGYVASGGTEANIQAAWIYRNYFMKEYKASPDQIALVYSEDSHYSLPKAANLLNIKPLKITVDPLTRELDLAHFNSQINNAKKQGVAYFIINLNLSTTMFGSVDNINSITETLNKQNIIYKIHIDAAFGGFIYPFTSGDLNYSFKNKHINSFTLDGHKMLQSPYGTGIFLIRKEFMKYVRTNEADYVQGKDCTLIGSRSGANAISAWMILRTYGSEGWRSKMKGLVEKTDRICSELNEVGVPYFRNPFQNIIAIQSKFVSAALAQKYFLVPDTHEGKPNWYKIVVMPHVKNGVIDALINDLNKPFHTRKK